MAGIQIGCDKKKKVRGAGEAQVEGRKQNCRKYLVLPNRRQEFKIIGAGCWKEWEELDKVYSGS
jgi:hypothetical protein